MPTIAPRREIAFINGNLADLKTLISGLRPDIEVIVLNPAGDGIEQIARALAGRSGLDAIHLVGHGASGVLQLGDLTLDAAYLKAHAGVLADIGTALGADGDILVYGCETGAGAAGGQFLRTLADATGADTAGSDDLSGGMLAGADWQLEQVAGQVETVSAMRGAAADNYLSTLALSAGTVHTYAQNTWSWTSMAQDSNGNIYLAHKLDGTAISIKKWTGSAWTEITKLTTTMTGDTYFSDYLSLQIDATGNLDLVFQHSKVTNNDNLNSLRGIKFGEYNVTTNTWSTALIEQASHPMGARNFSDPSLTITADGTLHSVYNFAYTWDNTWNYSIQYASSTNGGVSWTTSTVLTTTIGGIDELHNPTILTDSNGAVHLFYVREDNQNDNYGNLYHVTKPAGSSTWSAAQKIASDLESQFTVASDGAGKFYIGHNTQVYDANWQVTSSTLNVLSNETGSWVNDASLTFANSSAIYKMEFAAGKLHMLVASSPSDWSESNFTLLRKDGATWTKGYVGEGQLPSLSLQGENYFDEGTFIVTPDGRIIVVTESGELKNLEFTAGSSDDFGLFTNAAPVITGLAGDTTSFTAGATDLPGDGAYIDNQDTSLAVAVSDADGGDFIGGALTITRTSGAADGRFVFDADSSGILAFGPNAATLGGAIQAGDILFREVNAAWVEIGRVHATNDGQSGHNLVITFTGANANAAAAEELIKYLMYTAPTAGARAFSLTVSDGDGGTSTAAAFGMTGIDVTAPVVTNVISSPASGMYKLGDTVSIQVSFSENVFVSGSPALLLETGATDRSATYHSGSGGNALNFTYTVQAGDLSQDLDLTGSNALVLGGGSIRDAAGNDLVLTLATPGTAGSLGANNAIIVDGAAPTDITLSNGSLTTLAGAHAVVGTLGSVDANNLDSFTYSLVPGTGSGNNAAFEIVGGVLRAIDAAALSEGGNSVRVRTTDAAGNTYEEALSISVSSPPTVAITASHTTLGANGTSLITFTFSDTPVGFDATDITVAGGALAGLAVNPLNDKVYTATFTPAAGVQNLAASISVGAGKFADAGGLANVASTTNVAIGGDTLAASVTGLMSNLPDGPHKQGDTISIQVAFSEAVFVSGSPTLSIETGSVDRVATYTSGSGGTLLNFSYTVQAGDLSADLDLTGSTALQLNGGAIFDAAYNDASLTLPTPGAAGSLGANQAIVVDGAAPTDITLSNAAVTTVAGIHAVVGTLGSVDANGLDSFTYDLVAGAGSGNNAAFEIVGNSLRAINAATLSDGVNSVRVRTTDAVGNSYEEVLAITVSSPPTVAVSTSQATLGVGGTAQVTFTFSVAPVGFDASDVTVSGGAIGAVTVDPLNDKVYTATFTPAAGVQNLAASISVGAGSFVNAGGLANVASSTNAVIGGDTLAPGVVISSSSTVFKAGQGATVSFTFSEAPVDFVLGDITVTGGTLANLSATGVATVYTATFTPSANVETLSGLIGVAGATFTDAQGNAGTAALGLAIGGDTRAPVVSDAHISISGASGANGSFVAGDTVTATWDDSAAGDGNPDTVSASVDFSAFGGPAAVAATKVAGVWTATYQLAAGAIDATGRNLSFTVLDDAGNSSTRSDSSNAAVDTQSPVVSNGAITLSGATGTGGVYRVGDVVTATWNNAVDANLDVAGTVFDFSQFGGGPVAGSASGNAWSASYTVTEATIDAANRNVSIQVTDDAGNHSVRAGANNVQVDAILPHATAITVAGTPAGNATGIAYTVVFDEAVSGVDAGDFTLGATGTATGSITGVSGSGTTWTVNVGGISGNGSLALDLKAGATGIADGAGNLAAAGYTAGTLHTVAFNAAPVIGSNGGGATAAFGVAEKQRAVTTVAATDADGHAISYSIGGGADAALFEIDAATGVLRFIATPLHATAADGNHDHVYELTVRAQDSQGAVDTQALSVTVLADMDGDGAPDASDNDIDNDGRLNSAEDPVPGAFGVVGDGNGDGTADSAQLNVASLPTIVTGAPFATLEVAPGLSLSSVASIAAATGLPRNVKMPVGQFDFTIGNVVPGAAAQVSIYVDSALKVNGYYKQDTSGAWVNLATSVTTVGTKTKVTFSLIDGGQFDSDGLVNGSISDPGGLVTIAPVIASNGGAPAAIFEVLEGTGVTTVQAGPGASYAISGGADAALFMIDALTGALRFVDSASYGAPRDAGADNVYQVEVTASDAFGSDTQALSVRVTPTPVAPPPATIIDGVSVGTTTRGNADGSTSQVLDIPVVQPTRNETVGNNTVADIPLVSSNGGIVLSAQVPVGVGVQVTGNSAPTGLADGLTNLIREIRGVTAAGSHDQLEMTGGGSGFLAGLPQDANLVVQTIVPTAQVGAAAGPLVIQGLPAAAGQAVSALVIDAKGLPSGSVIQLQDVSFAAIVGSVTVTGGAGSQMVWGDGASQDIMLGADDDVLHGGGGNDIVGSAGGNDKIYGDEGDDLVFGGLGDDLVDGGAGIDTALLVGGGRADYTARFKDGQLVFSHRNGGADGSDTISHVEMLRFTHTPADTSARGSIERLYQAVLGRDGDAAGVDAWTAAVAKGASLAEVARHMVASAESQQLGATDAAFVTALYANTLGRSVDAAGLSYWTGALASGQASRAQLALGIADSTEKLAMTTVTNVALGDTDIGTLVRMYATLFDRKADDAGMNHWLSLSEAGVSMNDIADGFIGAGEATSQYSLMSNAQFTQSLYQTAMHRSGSAVELNYWTSLLDSGKLDRGDVLLQFAESAEKVALVGVVSTSLDGEIAG